MSFIVKGTKIPVSCDSCPLMRWIDYGIDGELQFCNALKAICEHEEGQRDVECPLVEIPPHGRLIDADKFKFDECGICDGCCETFNGNECSMCHKDCRCDFMKDIDEAQTVIEAEVKE